MERSAGLPAPDAVVEGRYTLRCYTGGLTFLFPSRMHPCPTTPDREAAGSPRTRRRPYVFISLTAIEYTIECPSGTESIP
jgi:hypothetical protein